jgi:hypothetical protein
MDYFYDGQIRRYVTQFMRVFIGFQYKVGGELRSIPVTYGDMSRQVASIINENSENKLQTVPKISCYISGLEMDTSRLSDATFVSKAHVRERRWTTNEAGDREYQNVQGAGYTVERLMPTPFKLSMKADIWTSNTDQKLQLLEQVLVLFNPSLELQTTDNYLDWTSLSVLDLKNINFSSRTIPQGADSEIDVCSMEFEIPIWLTPPAKVKKLGIVQTIISNMFTEQGDIVNLEEIIYNREPGAARVPITDQYGALLFKSTVGNTYDVSVLDRGEAVRALGLANKDQRNNDPLDWNTILELRGGYRPGSQIYFTQPSGFDLIGTYVINPLDPSLLSVTFDEGTIPTNNLIGAVDNQGRRLSGASAGTIDAIIDPYKFNPVTTPNGRFLGARYLMLDDVNPSDNRGGFTDISRDGSTLVPYDGPDAWKNLDGSDPLIRANTIIEWDGSKWTEIFNPTTDQGTFYITNLRTGIQYRFENEQWLKSFEGEYQSGYWGFVEDPC